MGLVAFVVEERGQETSGSALRLDEPSGPDAFSRAVDDLVSRKALDDPETAQMIAGHFAEVVVTRVLAGDDETAAQAGNALIAVLGTPYVMVKASRLRGDVEITEISRIEAGSLDEAEAVWTAALERLVSGRQDS